MGMELKEQLRRQLKTIGGPANLPPAPSGPILQEVDLLELAQALEHEVNRSKENGLTRISIHMNLDDASKFSSKLRRAALLGA